MLYGLVENYAAQIAGGGVYITPYGKGEKMNQPFGVPRNDSERLINHFGVEKAIEMFEMYGKEAYKFLPERGAGQPNFDPNIEEMGVYYDYNIEPTVGDIPTTAVSEKPIPTASADVAVPLAPTPPPEVKLPIIPILIAVVAGYFLFGEKLGIR